MTDTNALKGSLNRCKKELEYLQKEYEASQKGKPRRRGIVESDARSETALDKPLAGSDPRASSNDAKSEIPSRSHDLFKERCQFMSSNLKNSQGRFNGEAPLVGEVLHAVHKSTQEQKSSLSPRACLMAALQEKEGDKREFTLDTAIRRLEKFISEASYVILPRLESERAEAIEACRDLSSFFCEPGGEKMASNLLKILDEFACQIDRAVAKYDEQEKREARKRASKKRKSLTESKPPAPEMPLKYTHNGSLEDKTRPYPETPKASSHDNEDQGEKKSLVLMVNEMLKVAGDDQIKDFLEGKVYQNPDDRLRKIYEAERERNTDFFSPRRDILSAIKERKSIGGEDLAHQALSELRAQLEGNNSADAMAEVNASVRSLSKARQSRITNRWSSKAKAQEGTKESDEEDDTVSEMYVAETGGRKTRIADRWSRKVDNDTFSDTNNENNDPVERTDSEILTSLSQDTEDTTFRQRRRQSYMNRWASRTPVSEASSRDLDEESDIGAFQEMVSKQRQRYVSRWASKPNKEEIVD
jgi:hypothetical protein